MGVTLIFDFTSVFTCSVFSCVVDPHESQEPFHAIQTHVEAHSSPVMRSRHMVGPPMGALSQYKGGCTAGGVVSVRRSELIPALPGTSLHATASASKVLPCPSSIIPSTPSPEAAPAASSSSASIVSTVEFSAALSEHKEEDKSVPSYSGSSSTVLTVHDDYKTDDVPMALATPSDDVNVEAPSATSRIVPSLMPIAEDTVPDQSQTPPSVPVSNLMVNPITLKGWFVRKDAQITGRTLGHPNRADNTVISVTPAHRIKVSQLDDGYIFEGGDGKIYRLHEKCKDWAYYLAQWCVAMENLQLPRAP